MSSVRIQQRRDTAANWTSVNPVLAEGEIGLELDTDQLKVGDGSTAWSSLPYGGLQGEKGLAGTDGTNSGESFTVVKGTGTATENGTELVNVYNEAKLRTPYGNALSADNKFTIFIAPGTYTIGSQLAVNTDFINILSLDGTRSIDLTNGINVTADNCHFKGIDVGTNSFNGCGDAPNLVVEKCKGGDYSFASGLDQAGTYIDCEAGQGSFGNYTNASGTFTNCTAGIQSFGAYFGNASGVFINCTVGVDSFGDSQSFGSEGSVASGTFTNCTAGNVSFGFQEDASGTFTNCTAGNFSFGYYAEASGTFTDCTAGEQSFGVGFNTAASGTFTNCTAGNYSFGGDLSSASGTFTNCTGAYSSFGDSFVASGIFIDCTGEDVSFGRDADTSGTFINCTGGNDSFGDGGTLSGKVFYSRMTSGTFPTPSSGGVIRMSIDGNNNEVNAG